MIVINRKYYLLLAPFILIGAQYSMVSAGDYFEEVIDEDTYFEQELQTDENKLILENIFSDVTELADSVNNVEPPIIKYATDIDNELVYLKELLQNDAYYTDNISISSSNSRYSLARLIVLTDGSNIDFSTYNPQSIIYGIHNNIILQFNSSFEAESAAIEISLLEGVQTVEPDYIVSLDPAEINSTGDTIPWGIDAYSLSWGASVIGADSYADAVADYFFQNYQESSPISIALIDKGVDYSQSYISDYLLPGESLIQNISSATDDNGHGTHCAGILASCLQGLSPYIKIKPYKALGSNGLGTLSSIAESIYHAAMDPNV